MTYLEMSSKLNKTRFDEVERLLGEFRLSKARFSTGDIKDELEFRELRRGEGGASVAGVGGTEIDEGEGVVAMRASGT